MNSTDLRKLTDEELAKAWAGYKPNTPNAFLIEMEVRRRQAAPSEWRGWIALALSAVAIVVSVVGVLAR